MKGKNYFSDFSQPGSIEKDGGKGSNLKELYQKGINIPEGFVLETMFYQHHYPPPPNFLYEDERLLDKQCQQQHQTI